MTMVSAHELVSVKLCKVPLCDEVAEDSRGRYGRMCRIHKAAKMAEHARDRAAAKVKHRAAFGPMVATAKELQVQARRVERTSRRLDEQTARLRSLYLRFGVEAGFLKPRGDG